MKKIAISRGKYNGYNVAISLLKVIAMILIFNSHADLLFPPKVQFLASGGAIGNELFFLAGGLLFRKKKSEKFSVFVLKRYIRLYIPTYLMSLVLFAVGYIHLTDFRTFKEVFHLLIWPTQFWFVSAMFFIGIIHYFFIDTSVFEKKYKFVIYSVSAMIVIFLVYFVAIPDKTIWIVEDAKLFDTTIYFKCLYSFYVFSLGIYMRKMKSECTKSNSLLALMSFGGAFTLFYGFKYFLKENIIPMQFQIFSQFITIVVVITLYQFVCKMVDTINNGFLLGNIKCVFVLSDITLESFLVQFQVIQRVSLLNVHFPLNYLLAMVIVICVSLMFKTIDSYLSDLLIEKLT